MKDCALVSLHVKSATVVVSKKGKGAFYATTKHIPSSSLLGAIARKVVLNNVSKGMGNCANLKDPNSRPRCNTCNLQKSCPYTRIWINGELKVGYALLSSQGTLLEPPAIPSLQSLFESKDEEEKKYADGLLQMALYRIALKGEVSERILLKDIMVNKRRGKKESKDIEVREGKLKKLDLDLNESPHVGIDGSFKASEPKLLYTHTTIPRGTRLVTTVVGARDLIDELNNSEVTIGSSRSRGYGLIGLNIKDRMPVEKFIRNRADAIKEGFNGIRNLSEDFLGKNEKLLFTVTGLSPLPFEKDMNSSQVIAKRVKIGSDQVKYITYKRGVHLRYEFNDLVGGGAYFTLTPVMNPGYSGVIQVTGDVEKISDLLAEIEVCPVNHEPWFGWIYINHPIHYLGSTLHSYGGD